VKRAAALAAALAFAAAGDTFAQATAAPAGYPVKPVRLVVPVATGGNLDLVARAVAQALTESLGRPMIVENRPGASSVIGTELVARAAPDGYTLLMAATGFLIAPLMMRNPPYDPVRDFAGVSVAATVPQMLVVHPSLPVKSVRELIAAARARPGELNCATSGNGSGSHLALERFKLQAGVRVTRVPYNGDAPALVQLTGGQVAFKFDNLSTAIPLVNAGRLRALGVTSPARSPLLPEVPAIAETLPGYEASIFNGVVAPAGTPREVVARLNGEIAAFARAPEARGRFARQGVELVASATPEQFTAWLAAEYARYTRLVREAGITAE